MTFLHNNTTFEILKLQYENKKWTFKTFWVYEGKIKAILFNKEEMNIAPVEGEIYKLTYKGILDLAGNEKIKINVWPYKWNYTLKTYRVYTGILFSTTKLLLVKDN